MSLMFILPVAPERRVPRRLPHSSVVATNRRAVALSAAGSSTMHPGEFSCRSPPSLVNLGLGLILDFGPGRPGARYARDFR
jgi:hypothetical protein